jgi:hypothetical protein
MSPLELMQRLAARVPRPRLHLIRYHGVLAPHAKLRARGVPQGPEVAGSASAAAAAARQAEPVRARAQRMGRAGLLKQVFDIDMQRCPRCGAGQVKIIAAILERAVIGKILTQLGLDPRPPPRSQAREAGHEDAASVAGAHAGPTRWSTAAGAQPGWRCARSARNVPERAAEPQSEAGIARRGRSQPSRGTARRVRGADLVSCRRRTSDLQLAPGQGESV